MFKYTTPLPFIGLSESDPNHILTWNLVKGNFKNI